MTHKLYQILSRSELKQVREIIRAFENLRFSEVVELISASKPKVRLLPRVLLVKAFALQQLADGYDEDEIESIYEQILIVDPFNVRAMIEYGIFLDAVRQSSTRGKAMLRKANEITLNHLRAGVEGYLDALPYDISEKALASTKKRIENSVLNAMKEGFSSSLRIAVIED